MSKRTKIILIIGVAAVAAYLLYRWYASRQSQEGSGGKNPAALGSNLNSPAPELGAPGAASSPMVGPAVSVPVEIRISHSANENEPPSAGNPYANMIGARPVSTPLGQGGGNLRPPSRFHVYPEEETARGKDGASTYATTLEQGG